MIIRNGKLPLYRQLYQLLKEDILNGVYPRGALLPSERLLCRQYQLDRSTVRRALSVLLQENLIERHQGQGTIVLCDPARREAENLLFLMCKGHPRYGGDETFYIHSIDMLEYKLQKQNDRLVYASVFPGDDILEIIKRYHAKAVIAAGALRKTTCKILRSLHIPVVVYHAKVPGLACVLTDIQSGAAAACKTLVRYGHQKVGYIGVPSYNTAQTPLCGFRREWLKSGRDQTNLLVESGDWTEQSGYHAAIRLIRAHVTAVFAISDSIAAGVMRAARETGLSVPRELSVIGCGYISRPGAGGAALSSVYTDVGEMANATLMLLQYQRQTGSHHPVDVIVPAQFINRHSVAKAKTAGCAGA